VSEIRAAEARVKAAGGQIINGPHEVPGGAWIVQCLDPQGAMFALVAPPG
jgi:predicted enzyme related to lactoylglutathione lyase